LARAEGFGVPALDRAVGPIPAGATVLLRADPGIEGNAFLFQAAVNHLQAGRSVVVVATGISPASFTKGIHDFGGSAAKGKLVFVDAHSALLGSKADVEFPVPHPEGLAAVVTVLEEASKTHPKAVLLFESLNLLLDRSDAQEFIQELPRLLALAPSFQFTAALFTSWGYSADVDTALQAFDAVVRLRAVEDHVVLHHTISAAQTPWAKPGKPTLFKVERPAGILAYIPKIVVIGPHNAGKSTFVHSVSDAAVSVERMGTTVALDHGAALFDGVKAEVFGTPGQERFDPLLPMLAGQAVGAILVVDATQPDSFDRGRSMLDKIWKRGLRVVIALNKTDEKKAINVAEATALLSPPPGVAILPCIATQTQSARGVLEHMVNQILDGVEA
jgi:uncharacterized protein